MSGDFFTSQNSLYPRCVDGRRAEAFIEWVDGAWKVVKNGEEAAQENGPQFLGASLVFVRALQEIGGVSREKAFDITEQACKKTGLKLQVHLDDDHGEYDFGNMNEEEMLEIFEQHNGGCGFSKYAWGDEGVDVIAEAKKRHWRVQLLVGNHEEKGAVINNVERETFDTASGVNAQFSRFNTEVVEAQKTFEVIENIIEQDGFAEKAMDWMLQTYKDVVVALKGVESEDEIEVRG